MKALFITTETNETMKYVESLKLVLGKGVVHYVFSHRRVQNALEGNALDSAIHKLALEVNPSFIAYLGGCQGIMPSIDILRRLNREIAPSVCLVSDAGDLVCPWQPLLRRYDESGCFSALVAIDGVNDWEFSDRCMTLLTPVDPVYYMTPPRPHAERKMVFGFAGNVSRSKMDSNGAWTGRRHKTDKMVDFGLRTRQRDSDPLLHPMKSYQAYCDFMTQTRITPNFPLTGSYQHMHVKGRVVEAGLAGCLLLEEEGSPTSRWFEKDRDYLEFKPTMGAKSIVEYYGNKPEASQAFGWRLREKVLKEHHPSKFWGKVMERIGISSATESPRQVSHVFTLAEGGHP